MKEIERKFLVTGFEWLPEVREVEKIVQVYIDNHMRIRLVNKNGKKNPKASITFKSEGVFSRNEYSFDIPHQQAIEISHFYLDSKIEKMRYRLWYKGGYPWEIDVFQGANEGLILAEKELFGLNDELEAKEIPSWIGKDVTKDKRYYNSYLAKNPYKNWKNKNDSLD